MDSVGSHHGSIYGAQWTDGKIGGALSFDGADDYVDFGNDSNLAPEELTISLWVCPEANSGIRPLVNKIQYSSIYEINYDLELSSTNKISFTFASLDAKGRSTTQSSTNIPDNKWSLITVTRNGMETAIFINAIKDAETSYDFIPEAGDYPLLIGKKGTSWYKGRMDDVRIYDKALSEEEIQELYEEVQELN